MVTINQFDRFNLKGKDVELTNLRLKPDEAEGLENKANLKEFIMSGILTGPQPLVANVFVRSGNDKMLQEPGHYIVDTETGEVSKLNSVYGNADMLTWEGSRWYEKYKISESAIEAAKNGRMLCVDFGGGLSEGWVDVIGAEDPNFEARVVLRTNEHEPEPVLLRS